MTMVVGSDQDEALVAAARQMFQSNRQRSERVCFYRTPQRTPAGGRHVQAGWIGWGDTQDSIKLSKLARGYIPLDQYGFIEDRARPDGQPSAYQIYGPWGVILSQYGGPAEFPKDQILTYHWYDAERLRQSMNGQIPPTLKVRGNMVLWPQLAGEDLRIFACPECTDWRSLEAVFLARHLRIWHAYDRADIIAFGQQYGVDFSSEMNREGRVIQSLQFDSVIEEPQAEEDETPGFSLEMAMPDRRGPGRPRKEQNDG